MILNNYDPLFLVTAVGGRQWLVQAEIPDHACREIYITPEKDGGLGHDPGEFCHWPWVKSVEVVQWDIYPGDWDSFIFEGLAREAGHSSDCPGENENDRTIIDED